jgi:hypothetical protein
MFAVAYKGIIAALTAALILAAAAPAAAEEWRIAGTSGALWVSLPDAPRLVPAAPADTLPDGATLVTGPDGRALLTRADTTIAIGPDSVVSVPAPEGRTTTVLHRAGVVDFDVARQHLPYFRVETPFLGVLVKGTRFTLDVGPAATSLSVAGGLVEVSDPATGAVADVAAGQGAAIAAGAAMTVRGEGIEVRTGAPRPPPVKPLSRQDLQTLQSLPKGIGPSDVGAPYDVADAGAALIVSRILGNGVRNDAAPDAHPVAQSTPAEDTGRPNAGAPGGAARPAVSRSSGPRLTLPPGANPAELFAPRKAAQRTGPDPQAPDMAMLTAGILACLAGVALLGVGLAYVRARL